MKRSHFLLTLLLSSFFSFQAFSQKDLLQSGPMPGYTDMFESMLWVQTKSAAKVQFAYWVKDSLSAGKFYTEAVTTDKRDGFTAHLIAGEVLPGHVYEYRLLINGEPIVFDYPTTFQTQPLWQYRTEPPNFKIALGSCAYINEPAYDRPGRPYGGDYQIFGAIHRQRPDLMLWLGDNTYLREPDWFTRTGFLHRYTHTRSLPELQPLLASTHNYAIWDDHDYGTNDSDGSYIYKDLATEVFKMFWANPTYGLAGQGGITSYFQWADAGFFLLDNRYFRTPNERKTGGCEYFGKSQFDWLIDALAASKATFKFVVTGGQVLSTYPRFETYINLCPGERIELLHRIEQEGLKNVVFLTGDRHHTELSKLVNGSGHAVYDFTVSPLTASAHITSEPNLLRVPGTLVTQRNFGTIEISGPRNQRTLTLHVFDSDGAELWSRAIQAE
jgi:alkaline phosphatase D